MTLPLTDIEELRLFIDDPDDGTTDPFLTDPQLEALIAETGDLHAAAAKAWGIKAANISRWYDVDKDGSRLSRSQAFDHCLAMVEFHQNQSSGEIVSVMMSTAIESDLDSDEFAG